MSAAEEEYWAAVHAALAVYRQRQTEHMNEYAQAIQEPTRRLRYRVSNLEQHCAEHGLTIDKAFTVVREDAQREYDDAVAPLEASRMAADAQAHEVYVTALRTAQAAWDEAMAWSRMDTRGVAPPGRSAAELPARRPRRLPAATVMVPYVPGMLRPQTREEVKRQYPRAVFVTTPREDDESYPRALIEQSHKPGCLVVVEHDIVPPPGSIRKLLECVHPWCYHLVELDGRLTPTTLGLCKFGAGLKWQYADWMAEATANTGEVDRGRFHLACDTGISMWMDRHGIPAHVHEPPPLHLHWPGFHGW